MRRSAVSRNNVAGVTVATAGKARHIIVTITNGWITSTVIAITTMTSARRNRRTRLLILIATTRYSSHAVVRPKTMPPIAMVAQPKTMPRIALIAWQTPMLGTSLHGLLSS